MIGLYNDPHWETIFSTSIPSRACAISQGDTLSTAHLTQLNVAKDTIDTLRMRITELETTRPVVAEVKLVVIGHLRKRPWALIL